MVGNGNYNSTIHNKNSDIYGFGDNNFSNGSFHNCDDIYGLGAGTFQSAIFSGTAFGDVNYIFGFGNQILFNSRVTNSFSVSAFGGPALSGAILNNTEGLMALGHNAGNSISGAYTNVVIIGSGASVGATGANKVIIGGDMTLQSTAFSSLATDAAVAISATGWTNSYGKDAFAWAQGTNVTYVIYNNAGTAVRTNTLVAGTHILIPLQSLGKFIVTAGSTEGSAYPR